MSENDEIQVLDELIELLEKQVELARRGGLADLLRLTDKSGSLVARTAQAGLLDKPEHRARKIRLANLYRDLNLLLSTQQGAVAEQLRSVRKGKKTLAVYQSSV